MDTVRLEKAGVSPKNIRKFIETLEKNRLVCHNVIMARGNSKFFEAYWQPFDERFMHRMYSVSKSLVAIAIGFMLQDGLIGIDDKIIDYFGNYMKNQKDENMRSQTIRHMLMMSTAKVERSWFAAKPDDRVQFYFDNDIEESRPSGTIFQYDSAGSFILGCLVENLSGMRLEDYLNEKLFSKIGITDKPYCLKCPGGHSWSDSAFIMRPDDLMKVARFVLNLGSWNGEQLLNREYLEAATSDLISNNDWDTCDVEGCGYGYFIWRTVGNCFFFNGMGCQLAVCCPDKDMILVFNGDNQGHEAAAKRVIIESFIELIVNSAEDGELESDDAETEKLADMVKTLKLSCAAGAKTSGIADKVNGVTYITEKNPMGITKFRLTFSGTEGVFEYTNAQGDKRLRFGMCENVFGEFPQEGYAGEIGTVATKGMYYKCAASAAWVHDNQLHIKVQITDKYFGRLGITFGFRDNLCGIRMNKCAEDFLDEYTGYASGKALPD